MLRRPEDRNLPTSYNPPTHPTTATVEASATTSSPSLPRLFHSPLLLSFTALPTHSPSSRCHSQQQPALSIQSLSSPHLAPPSPLISSPALPSPLISSPALAPLTPHTCSPGQPLPFSLSTPHPHSPGQPLPLKSIPLQPLPAPSSLPRLLHLAALARPSLSLSQLCPLTALARPSLSPP